MDFGGLLPARSVEDVLAERIRIQVGGEVYDLPVLPIAESRAWKERMDYELGRLLALIGAEDDGDAAIRLIDGSEALFMDLLVSYDARGVLPPRDDLERSMTPLGLIRAVLEVWRAARPLADIALVGMTQSTPTEPSPPPTSSWRRRMGGALGRSSAS